MKKPRRPVPLAKRADILDAQVAVLVKVIVRLIKTGWAQDRDEFAYKLLGVAQQIKGEAIASRERKPRIL